MGIFIMQPLISARINIVKKEILMELVVSVSMGTLFKADSASLTVGVRIQMELVNVASQERLWIE